MRVIILRLVWIALGLLAIAIALILLFALGLTTSDHTFGQIAATWRVRQVVLSSPCHRPRSGGEQPGRRTNATLCSLGSLIDRDEW